MKNSDAQHYRHAICIQCHNKPEIVNKLTEYLPEEYFDFYIHIDKKSDIFSKIEKKSNVYFCNRLDVNWGQLSQIKATLALFDMIDTKKYSYVHLISGNDFIIKTVDSFIELFEDNNKEYIECVPVPNKWKSRYEILYPKFLIKRPSCRFTRLLRAVYRIFVMKTGIFRQKKLPTNNFYVGSSWFSITGKMVAWIKEYLGENNNYESFFNHSICCDEIFFSTLAMMSPYADKIANRHLRFLDWQNSKSGGPRELQTDDVDNMLSSDCIFARKIVNISVIQSIIKRLQQ